MCQYKEKQALELERPSGQTVQISWKKNSDFFFARRQNVFYNANNWSFFYANLYKMTFYRE